MSIRNISKIIQKMVQIEPIKMQRQVPLRNFATFHRNQQIQEQNAKQNMNYLINEAIENDNDIKRTQIHLNTEKMKRALKEPSKEEQEIQSSQQDSQTRQRQRGSPSRITGNLSKSSSSPKRYNQEFFKSRDIAQTSEGQVGNTRFTESNGRLLEVQFGNGVLERGLNINSNKTKRSNRSKSKSKMRY